MKSLLIVDDHLMIGSALRYLLSQLDPDVATTAVGSMAEAMELLNAGNRYDRSTWRNSRSHSRTGTLPVSVSKNRAGSRFSVSTIICT